MVEYCMDFEGEVWKGPLEDNKWAKYYGIGDGFGIWVVESDTRSDSWCSMTVEDFIKHVKWHLKEFGEDSRNKEMTIHYIVYGCRNEYTYQISSHPTEEIAKEYVEQYKHDYPEDEYTIEQIVFKDWSLKKAESYEFGKYFRKLGEFCRDNGIKMEFPDIDFDMKVSMSCKSGLKEDRYLVEVIDEEGLIFDHIYLNAYSTEEAINLAKSGTSYKNHTYRAYVANGCFLDGMSD